MPNNVAAVSSCGSDIRVKKDKHVLDRPLLTCPWCCCLQCSTSRDTILVLGPITASFGVRSGTVLQYKHIITEAYGSST